jgi:hypothetical protein
MNREGYKGLAIIVILEIIGALMILGVLNLAGVSVAL